MEEKLEDKHFEEFNVLVKKLLPMAEEALNSAKTHEDLLEMVSKMEMKDAYILGNIIGSRIIDVGPAIVMEFAKNMSSSKDSYVLGFCVGHLLMLIKQNKKDYDNENFNAMFS